MTFCQVGVKTDGGDLTVCILPTCLSRVFADSGWDISSFGNSNSNNNGGDKGKQTLSTLSGACRWPCNTLGQYLLHQRTDTDYMFGLKTYIRPAHLSVC
jgi:hypothetical protein